MATTAALLVLCVFAHSQTFVMGAFSGEPAHAQIVREQLKTRLVNHGTFEVVEREALGAITQEAALGNSGAAAAEGEELKIKLGQYLVNGKALKASDRHYLFSLSLVEMQSSAIAFACNLSYENLETSGEMTARLIGHLDRFFEGGAGLPAAGKPAGESDLSDEVSRYLDTEKAWLERGATSYDLETYYNSKQPFPAWIENHTFDPALATLAAAVPAYSGLNYTRNWGPGLFWSVSEIVLLAYGVTRKTAEQKWMALSVLVPIGAADIFISRWSARRENKKFNALEEYYRTHPYPFSFMKDDGNEKSPH